MHLSAHGLDFIEGHLPYILSQVLPREFNRRGDERLDICVPWSTVGNPDLCAASRCVDGQRGCPITLNVEEAGILTQPPGRLYLWLKVGGVDDRLNFDYDTGLPGVTASCSIRFFKKGGARRTPAKVSASVPIDLRIDAAAPSRPLTIDVGAVRLDLSDVDLVIRGRGGFDDSLVCRGVNRGRRSIHAKIEKQVERELSAALAEQIEGELCEACGPGEGCGAGSRCEDAVCRRADGSCELRSLGLAGRLEIGAGMGDVAATPSAGIDVHLQPGGMVRVDKGVSLGVRAGFEPGADAACVPDARSVRPAMERVVVSPAITAQRRPGTDEPFMLSAGVHRSALEHLLWSSWASGAACISFGGASTPALNTTTLSFVLPALLDIAPRGGVVSFEVVPRKAPRVKLGRNRVVPDPHGTGWRIEEGLVTIDWRDIDLHLFAEVEGVKTRLLTLRIDLLLPVAVLPDGMGGLMPVVGSFDEAVVGVEARGTQMPADSLKTLEELVPTLLSLATRPLVEAIPRAIPLPELPGFRLVLEDRDITSVDGGEYVAVFADLERATPRRRLAIDTLIMGHSLDVSGARPQVELELSAIDPHGAASDAEVEYSYRVDDGLWSLFDAKKRLVVDDPLLRLEGPHAVEVRARYRGLMATMDREPARVAVVVDLAPPTLRVELRAQILHLLGEDAAGEEGLDYRYRLELLDEEHAEARRLERSKWSEWSEWGRRVDIDLGDVGDAGVRRFRVEAQARDRAGYVTTHREAMQMEMGSDAPAVASPSGEAAGDVDRGGLLRMLPMIATLLVVALLALAGAGWVVVRRRRRQKARR